MRTAFVIILTGALAGAAAAAPSTSGSKPAPPAPADQSFHVTVTAGQGRLGVGVLQISRELRAHYGAPADRGVLVDRVQPDSPAERAGVRVGDLVLELDGEAAASATDMISAMSDRKKGDQIDIVVLRDGHRQTMTATLDADPARIRTFGKSFRGTFGPKDFHWDFDLDDMREMFEDLPMWQQTPHRGHDLRDRLLELEKRLEQLERKGSRA